MSILNYFGFLFIVGGMCYSLAAGNRLVVVILILIGAVLTAYNGCTVVEDKKNRVFLPMIQFLLGYLSILAPATLSLFRECGWVRCLLFSLAGLAVILGLKVPEIIVHRAIASPIAMIVYYFAGLTSKDISTAVGYISCIFGIAICLLGIIFSDRRWLNKLRRNRF